MPTTRGQARTVSGELWAGAPLLASLNVLTQAAIHPAAEQSCSTQPLISCVFSLSFIPPAGENQPISSADTQSSIHKGRKVSCDKHSPLPATVLQRFLSPSLPHSLFFSLSQIYFTHTNGVVTILGWYLYRQRSCVILDVFFNLYCSHQQILHVSEYIV